MATFVWFSDGLTGSVFRGAELCRRLTARGHCVVVASPVDVASRVGDIDGVTIELLDRATEIRDHVASIPRPGRAARSIRGAWRWARRARAGRRASIANDEIEQLLDRVDPDLVLVDIEFHTAAIVCRARQQPAALMTGWFTIFPDVDVPPLHATIVPDGGAETRRRIRHAWVETRRRARRARRRIVLSPSGPATPFRTVVLLNNTPIDLRSFARHRGLRLRDIVDDRQWLRPFVIDGLPIVSATVAELDLPHRPDPRFRHAGALVPSGPRDDVDDGRSRRRLDEFLATRDASRPLVYAAVGTYWRGGVALLEAIVDAFADDPSVDLVVGLGGQYGELATRDLPGHILVLDWAPQSEILRVSDAAILHGGITSILEAIAASTPVLCFSTHTNDQDGTVARVAFHELGIVGERTTATRESIRRDVRRLLEDDRIGANIERMRQTIDAARLDASFETLLEGMISER